MTTAVVRRCVRHDSLWRSGVVRGVGSVHHSNVASVGIVCTSTPPRPHLLLSAMDMSANDDCVVDEGWLCSLVSFWSAEEEAVAECWAGVLLAASVRLDRSECSR